jgi:hypothetical protein
MALQEWCLLHMLIIESYIAIKNIEATTIFNLLC